MPYFRYTVRDNNGKKKTSIEEAIDREALVERLQAQGFYVISVVSEIGDKGTEKKKVRKFKRSRIKLEDMVLFARQLSTMLNAGVPLLKSLEVISSQVESKRLTGILGRVRVDLEKGSSLSGAFAKHPKVFNQFWISLAEVGEASGTLPVVLDRLAFYLEQRADFQRTITSAMLYPAILMVVCVVAMFVFSFLIIPKFNIIFNNFDMELPMLTKTILGVFGTIKDRFFLVSTVLCAVFLALSRYLRTPVGRRNLELLLLRLPVLGGFFRDSYIEKFASHLSILVESGVPLLYALEISERMVDNLTVAAIINKVKDNVRSGKLIAEPMQEAGFFHLWLFK